MRTLVVAVHDGSDQLAVAHIAESDEELEEVLHTASGLGPVWSFPLVDGELLQHWEEARPDVYDPTIKMMYGDTIETIADRVDPENNPDYRVPYYRDEFEQLERVPLEERPSAWLATIALTNGDGQSQAEALREVIDLRLEKP